jgi:hypothetical protein
MSTIIYTLDQVKDFRRRFAISESEFHFPRQSFLETGYAPPGGYVKDFSLIEHQGRYHLFHIDGRPEERCIASGNEISFGHASTSDFRHWIRHRMPLAVGERPWENEHIWAPYVARIGGQFVMVYMAMGRDGKQALTYATSPDLEVWTKSGVTIDGAKGRDPFLCSAGGIHRLYFTFWNGGVGLVETEDFQTWVLRPKVIQDLKRAQAESPSVHELNGRHVIWYNDYYHVKDPSGDFRAVYAMSDDPCHFDPANIRPFEFQTGLPTHYSESDWLEKRPIPVSIELIKRCAETTWLVAYFRWHIDRFRLFVGLLEWDREPARIREVTNPAILAANGF